MGKCVYVDNSNVWIEGKYHSAVSKGMFMKHMITEFVTCRGLTTLVNCLILFVMVISPILRELFYTVLGLQITTVFGMLLKK